MSDARILIIGLSGRQSRAEVDKLIGERVVLVRSASFVAQWLHSTGVRAPHGWTIDYGYDDLFDSADLNGIVESIASDIARRAEQHPIAYLVPGPGFAGDLTAELLSQATNVAIAAGDLPIGPLGAVQVVDALALAHAEMSAPFSAGLAPFDAQTATLVLNWHGASVTRLAEQRLRRLTGIEPPAPDDNGAVTIPTISADHPSPSIASLRQIYARLRRPDGCPWDREQTELSTLPYISNEAQELGEAVEAGDWEHAAEELGDVLGNIIMIAQIAEEHGRFTFEDVVNSVSAKLVRRHPHVFGDLTAATPDEVLGIWNQVKQQERKQQATQPIGEG